jgi:hypothetical protein
MKKTHALEWVKNWIRLQEIFQLFIQQYEKSTNFMNDGMRVVKELSLEELEIQLEKISH